jgi:hypothetical protein
MNLLFKISKTYIPVYVKKRELMNLFYITASAFETSVPPMAGLSFEECLTEFAHFTKSEVEQMGRKGGDIQAIQDWLYQGAYEFGAKLRKRFRISTASDVMDASRFLYHILGIDFRGTKQGTITISQCFFSRYYSSSICGVISSLDAGMLAGLSAGGRMSFSERMTEGSQFCKAQLLFKGQFQ